MHVPVRDGAPVRAFEAYMPPAAAAILTLSGRRCHWPLGDIEGDGFHFCLEICERGLYCPAHRRLARRKAS